jgi:hypothetical protein
MTPEVPISHHLDLFSYWLSKRNGRTIPAYGDMDPVELGQLLPFLFIVDKPAAEFRYRLIGTRVVQDLGRDLTGKPLSDYAVNSPEMIPAVQALGECVFANAQPAFARCHRATGQGTIYNSSALVLPLSDDGRHVNMFIATRITRFNENAKPSQNWLEGTRLKLGMSEIHHAPDLERRCRDWKGVYLADGPPQVRSRSWAKKIRQILKGNIEA